RSLSKAVSKAVKPQPSCAPGPAGAPCPAAAYDVRGGFAVGCGAEGVRTPSDSQPRPTAKPRDRRDDPAWQEDQRAPAHGAARRGAGAAHGQPCGAGVAVAVAER